MTLPPRGQHSMMMDTFGRTLGLPLLLLALTYGCTSTGSRDNPFRGDGPGDESQVGANEAIIEVEHMGRTGSDVTVYLVGSGQSRRRLGRVSFGDEERFRVTFLGGSEYRLLGEIVGERDLASRSFVLRSGRGIRWNIALNQITILR